MSSPSPNARDPILSRVARLRSSIHRMQGSPGVREGIPVCAGLRPLLSEGLRPGACYGLAGSGTLLSMLLEPVSAAGSWCAIVGVPEFGSEAAAAMGVDLERLALVPDPGTRWPAVVSALADAVTLVAARPGGEPGTGWLERLEARMRRSGSVLVLLGTETGVEARLRVIESIWEGLGDGEGFLAGRRMRVRLERGGLPARDTWLWAPGDGSLPIPSGAATVRVLP